MVVDYRLIHYHSLWWVSIPSMYRFPHCISLWACPILCDQYEPICAFFAQTMWRNFMTMDNHGEWWCLVLMVNTNSQRNGNGWLMITNIYQYDKHLSNGDSMNLWFIPAQLSVFRHWFTARKQFVGHALCREVVIGWCMDKPKLGGWRRVGVAVVEGSWLMMVKVSKG